jgi:hypothetical protein
MIFSLTELELERLLRNKCTSTYVLHLVYHCLLATEEPFVDRSSLLGHLLGAYLSHFLAPFPVLVRCPK